MRPLTGWGRLLHVERDPAPTPVPTSPVLAGDGPATFSTCRALSVVPAFIADVNGYYRALGVDPRASKGTLRKAYVAAGGPTSPRLTYVLTQLLDPAVRASYDASPLGEEFLDAYVAQRLTMLAKARAAAAMASLARVGVVYSPEAEQDLIQRMFSGFMDARGYDTDWSADTPADLGVVDNLAWSGNHEFGYSYYQWRTSCADTQRLVQWQELLVSSFSRKGVVTTLAVGFHGRMAHPWLLAQVGYRIVVFLNDGEQPTSVLADAVADRVEHDQRYLN